MKPLALFVLALLAACTGSEDDLFVGRRDLEQHRAANGTRSFVTYCVPCHGDQGAGDGRFLAYALEPKPPDMGTHAFQAARSDDQLLRAITDGSRSVGRSNLCPPWGRTLPEEEIRYIVHLVRQLERHPGLGLRPSIGDKQGERK